jgi:hypothetical protein
VAFSALSNHERVNACAEMQQYQNVSKLLQNATKHSRLRRRHRIYCYINGLAINRNKTRRWRATAYLTEALINPILATPEENGAAPEDLVKIRQDFPRWKLTAALTTVTINTKVQF